MTFSHTDFSFTQVPITYREDGSLRFGDSIMLRNKVTEGAMVCDMSDRIVTHDEAYAVTSVGKVGPCARSVYVIEPNAQNAGDDIVRYGQEVRIAANPYILNKPLYLNS